jgi:hypothetical protein
MKILAEWDSKLIAAALFFAMAGPGLTRGPEFQALTGKTIRLRRHMDLCEWRRIDEAKVAGNSTRGVLYELNTTSWASRHKNGKYDRPAPKTDESHGINYFFCSKQKPAAIWQDEGKWIAPLLQPGDENAVFGANESAYTKYWAARHSVYVDDVYAEGTKLGRKFGYHF